MTNNCYGNEQVDTLPMRTAMVKYLMGIHGIVDKYFNYNKINAYLHREYKAYAKKIMCDPQSVTVADFSEMKSLTPEERCHVCIIAMETKKRVELIYVTKVLSQLLGL